MRLREFIDTALERYQERIGGYNEKDALKYSPQEIKAISLRVLEELYNIPTYKYITMPDSEIGELKLNESEESGESNQEITKVPSEIELQKLIDRIVNEEPVQYIVGFERFCGIKFNVAPGVLIPRPETEQLVKIILNDIVKDIAEKFSHPLATEKSENNPVRVLDLCTGSGCIAWSLWKLLNQSSRLVKPKSNLEVYGCDISPVALKYAKNQAISLDAPYHLNQDDFQNSIQKPYFFECDILSETALDIIREESNFGLDIIVSNPPYITERERETMRTNVKGYEPHKALFVPDDQPLLFYQAICNISKQLLRKGGSLYLECNNIFVEDVAKLLETSGFVEVEIVRDFSDSPRFVKAKSTLSIV